MLAGNEQCFCTHRPHASHEESTLLAAPLSWVLHTGFGDNSRLFRAASASTGLPLSFISVWTLPLDDVEVSLPQRHLTGSLEHSSRTFEVTELHHLREGVDESECSIVCALTCGGLPEIESFAVVTLFHLLADGADRCRLRSTVRLERSIDTAISSRLFECRRALQAVLASQLAALIAASTLPDDGASTGFVSAAAAAAAAAVTSIAAAPSVERSVAPRPGTPFKPADGDGGRRDGVSAVAGYAVALASRDWRPLHHVLACLAAVLVLALAAVLSVRLDVSLPEREQVAPCLPGTGGRFVGPAFSLSTLGLADGSADAGLGACVATLVQANELLSDVQARMCALRQALAVWQRST